MIKKVLKKVKKVNNNINLSYLKYCSYDIDEKLVLLEGGQGSNINGNMFSMLRELKTNPRWSDYKCVFVVTKNTLSNAQKRMEFYGFDDVILSIRNSKEYSMYLATAKYLMTDNSFPPYFDKREQQVFLNTWHGTPLKTLGKSDKSNLASLANIQKNYLMSDYALFPNEFTRNVFMKDYDLQKIFKGNSLIANYPRNYVFYDNEQASKMKSELGLSDKIVYAYMPTWRGTGRTADTAHQVKKTTELLAEIDSLLDDNKMLLVNLHFLLSSEIDCNQFKHIKSFPFQYDTYEVLNACDGLITDYSSVFFDFAVTGKKIILYTYDEEDYMYSRGVYIPFEELPFPIVKTADEVVDFMDNSSDLKKDFVNTYCTDGYIDSCEKIFEMMVTGQSDCFKLEKNQPSDKKLCLLYCGTLPKIHFDNIKRYIADNPEYDYILAYRHNFTVDSKDFVLSLDEEITTLGIISAFQLIVEELVAFSNCKAFNKYKENKKLSSLFTREGKRLFYSIKPDKVVDFSCGNFIIAGILNHICDNKELVKHCDYFCSSKKFEQMENHIRDYEVSNGFSVYDMSAWEKENYLLKNEDSMADNSYKKNSRFNNILPFYITNKKGMKCVSLFSFKTPVPTALKDTYVLVGENQYKAKFLTNKNKKKKSHFGIFSFYVPLKDVVDMPATNMVAICYKNQYDLLVKCHMIYFSFLRKFFLGLRSPMLHDKNTSTVAIFRQSKKNRLNIYVRSFIKSDKLTEQFKQFVAFFAAPLWNSKKTENLVLLYEKNSSKYEESASVTFETLIDNGYNNAYFIVDKDYEYIDRIPDKYLPNIIYKNTFKHYLYFFKSKTFIGTEALVHAIDLKIFNIPALKKIADKDINYVFLQHGVMYMVSLDSEARGMFKRKKLHGKYRVVVSSQAEAKHFIQLGNHYADDLYITGLPKFDRNKLLDDADRIVIMPTWRPWEINLARDDFSQTGYFKMVMKIYNSVPEELKDKVVILPHPLIVNELKQLNHSISDKVIINARYDDILSQTRVLITDYSSIAYDAFYRGTRVIFYWEEKDHCMQQYGPSTKLMLNEENVYGDCFYNTDGLSDAIKDNYYSQQKQKYIDNYSNIVQFRDGKNAERLIQELKKDNII